MSGKRVQSPISSMRSVVVTVRWGRRGYRSGLGGWGRVLSGPSLMLGARVRTVAMMQRGLAVRAKGFGCSLCSQDSG